MAQEACGAASEAFTEFVISGQRGMGGTDIPSRGGCPSHLVEGKMGFRAVENRKNVPPNRITAKILENI